MRILVTGGNGQLGCSFRAISADYPLHEFIFTDMPELDITDRVVVDDIVDRKNIDVIINCAAYTAVDRAQSEPEIAERINVYGAGLLADIARKRGVKLVHISTDYVFSGENCHPIKESDPTAPIGVYGDTKLRGEQTIEAAECDAAVVRTAWLYSEFGANFLKTMLRVGEQGSSLNVVYDQIGTPTYAPDLARAVMVILDSGIRGYEVYHYSDEGVASWYDFAKEIFLQAGMSVVVNAIESSSYSTPAKRPSYSVLSKDKIKAKGACVPYWRDSLKVCMREIELK